MEQNPLKIFFSISAIWCPKFPTIICIWNWGSKFLSHFKSVCFCKHSHLIIKKVRSLQWQITLKSGIISRYALHRSPLNICALQYGPCFGYLYFWDLATLDELWPDGIWKAMCTKPLRQDFINSLYTATDQLLRFSLKLENMPHNPSES